MDGAKNAAETPQIEHIVDMLNAELPDLASQVIRRYLDDDDPATHDFLLHPDGREQHQTRWHQWGIITHTRVFLDHYDADIPGYLREWGLWGATSAVLDRTVDGASRWDLLRVGIVLHDIGKFGARFRGRTRFHFTGHEDLSGRIIRDELRLEDYGLTPAQAEYVATVAEDHFVLGQIRRKVRELGGYDENFAHSPELWAIADRIKRDHPDDFVEIGVLFLGDSLAKADPQTGPPDAVSQYDINIEIARAYLTRVLIG
jgi:hypothetical protein